MDHAFGTIAHDVVGGLQRQRDPEGLEILPLVERLFGRRRDQDFREIDVLAGALDYAAYSVTLDRLAQPEVFPEPPRVAHPAIPVAEGYYAHDASHARLARRHADRGRAAVADAEQSHPRGVDLGECGEKRERIDDVVLALARDQPMARAFAVAEAAIVGN